MNAHDRVTPASDGRATASVPADEPREGAVAPQSIRVVGAGYVGLVTAVVMATLGHLVELVETRPDRLEALRSGRIPIYEAGLQAAFEACRERISVSARPGDGSAEIVMICVGTPINDAGRSDLSQVVAAMESIVGETREATTVVIRSTLPIGVSGSIARWTSVPTSRIFTNPEFLRQGTALADFMRPERIVIGAFEDADPRALARVEHAFAGIDAPILVVSIEEAELIKNSTNAFLALRLSFVNELATLCEAYGADVERVLDGIGRDPRIGRGYMRPSFGFGGGCLPKELQTLTAAGQSRSLPMHVAAAASAANEDHHRRFAERIDTALDGVAGRTIALLGLAFKAGTDDTRASPSLAVARILIDRGAIVRGYDPEAAEGAHRDLPALQICDTPDQALSGADAAVIATEWPQFRELDWGALQTTMAKPVIFDGRRLLDGEAMAALGFRYEAIGARGRMAQATPTRPDSSERGAG